MPKQVHADGGMAGGASSKEMQSVELEVCPNINKPTSESEYQLNRASFESRDHDFDPRLNASVISQSQEFEQSHWKKDNSPVCDLQSKDSVLPYNLTVNTSRKDNIRTPMDTHLTQNSFNALINKMESESTTLRHKQMESSMEEEENKQKHLIEDNHQQHEADNVDRLEASMLKYSFEINY